LPKTAIRSPVDDDVPPAFVVGEAIRHERDFRSRHARGL